MSHIFFLFILCFNVAQLLDSNKRGAESLPISSMNTMSKDSNRVESLVKRHVQKSSLKNYLYTHLQDDAHKGHILKQMRTSNLTSASSQSRYLPLSIGTETARQNGDLGLARDAPSTLPYQLGFESWMLQGTAEMFSTVDRKSGRALVGPKQIRRRP